MVRLEVKHPRISTEKSTHQVDDETVLVARHWPNGVTPPPSQLESDEPPLESDLHRIQLDLLIRLLKYWCRERDDVYISGNLTVYYSAQQIKTRDFRGPDIFIVLGAEPRDRDSWIVWEEQGKYPNVVIELLSDSTAPVDRGIKKDLYQNIWRLPEYYWFHPKTLEFKGFRLINGKYKEIEPDENGRLWSNQVGLALGIEEYTLRWFTDKGALIPLPEEAERQAKEQERQAKERLENYLRSQGIDPNNLP